jgi:hypothetical protein
MPRFLLPVWGGGRRDVAAQCRGAARTGRDNESSGVCDMGKFFKWFFIILLVLIAVGVGVAYLFPQHAIVTRTVEVKAKPETVWPLISDLKDGWPKWDPWTEMDPTIKTTFGEDRLQARLR